MTLTYYVPIFEWGESPTVVSGTTSGCEMYQSLQDLYGFNPTAIGYFKVTGKMPTQEEFEKQQNG